MIRVLVMSDSHGSEAAVRKALEAQPQAAAVIHLGDGAAEAQRVAAKDTARTWYIVRGNCDCACDIPVKRVITLGGKRLYLTHGFAERVKSGLLTLSLTAREQEVDAALYGHTHMASTDYQNGILLLNPGSIGSVGAYSVLEIDETGIRSHAMRL